MGWGQCAGASFRGRKGGMNATAHAPGQDRALSLCRCSASAKPAHQCQANCSFRSVSADRRVIKRTQPPRPGRPDVLAPVRACASTCAARAPSTVRDMFIVSSPRHQTPASDCARVSVSTCERRQFLLFAPLPHCIERPLSIRPETRSLVTMFPFAFRAPRESRSQVPHCFRRGPILSSSYRKRIRSSATNM